MAITDLHDSACSLILGIVACASGNPGKRIEGRDVLMLEPASTRCPFAALVLSLAISVALLVGGCSSGVSRDITQHGSTADATAVARTGYHPAKTVTYGASWAITYNDLKSLKQAADLGVVGTITRASAVATDQSDLVFTDFVFTIKTALSDPGRRLTGASIIVHQTGGIVGSTLYQMEDDPLFEIGEQAVLFLHEYSPGHYFVVGGPTGRFVVQNGMVGPINDEGIALGTSPTEAAFAAMVQKA